VVCDIYSGAKGGVVKGPYFITGIGTGVGKTFVTAALAYQARNASVAVRAVKPVLSGFDRASPEQSDAGVLLAVMEKTVDDPSLDAVSPWRFKAPLSPHIAAEKEGRTVDLHQVVEWCRQQQTPDQLLLIQGVGGVMVPLNREALVLDWMRALGWPVIVVAASYLGAINHTLLTCDTLAKHAIPITAIIVSESEENNAGLSETCDAINTFLRPRVPVIPLPRAPHSDTPWKAAPSLLPYLA